MASTVISGAGYPFGAFVQDPVSGQWNPWPVDSNKVPQVSLMAADLSAVVTMQNAANATGTGTVLPTAGMGVATIAISGTFNATITFEGKGPDNNWYQINAKQRGVGTIGTTTTSPGLYELNARGLSAIRANITSYTSGTITVVGWAQPLEASPEMVNATLTGSKVIGPTKIASFSYTTFPANTTVYPTAQAVLNRNATKRTFWLVNNLNQTFSANPQITLWDSTQSSINTLGDNVTFTGGAPAANGGKTYRTSEAAGGLAAHLDSVMLTCQMGSTAPTSGTLDLWVVEVLGA